MKYSLLFFSTLFVFSCRTNNVPAHTSSTGSVPDTTEALAKEFPGEFQKPEGIIFQVDQVPIAADLLFTSDARKVFENKIRKKISFFPEELDGQKVIASYNHGLIQTVQECYDSHRPLVLTPDVIWMAICQGVSLHINENHKTLENKLFKSGKPDKLTVRNDSLEFNAKHWNSLIASLSEQTRQYTKDDFYSFFVSEFSTTTPLEKTAYQVTLLEGYKKTFQYIGDSGCGIPSIHLAGSTKDWETIYSKLETLHQIGLEDWAEQLKPVIREFVNASEGKQNKVFWQDIFKNSVEYNAYYLSGWIIKFFPYIKVLGDEEVYDEASGERIVTEIFKPNPYIKGSDYLLSELSTDNFPSGVSQVPLIWNNHFRNETKKMDIYAGFFGIKQYDDKSLEPLIAWAVCEENAGETHHQLSENKWTSHALSNYWTPNIVSQLTDSAIYDSKRFKTQQESLNYLRKYISESIRQSRFKDVNLSGDTLRVVVLSNGTTGNVTLNDPDREELQHYISELLQQLPKSWMPALANPEKAMMLMEEPDENTGKIKMRVNSEVKVYF